MARTYSEGFHCKVIRASDLDCLKKSEASQLLPISRNQIKLQSQRKAAIGDILPKLIQVRASRGEITNWKNFVHLLKRITIKPKGKHLRYRASIEIWGRPSMLN